MDVRHDLDLVSTFPFCGHWRPANIQRMVIGTYPRTMDQNIGTWDENMGGATGGSGRAVDPPIVIRALFQPACRIVG